MGGALVALAMKAGFDPERLLEEFHRIDEVPFDAGHRFMATVHHHTEGEPFLLLKGAPEKIVAMCAAECRDDGTQLLDQAEWLQRAHALAARGQRSEEHTSELQSLMRISYAVFCLNKTNTDRFIHYRIDS